MTNKSQNPLSNCPFCYSDNSSNYAEEVGYLVSRCKNCDILFVNPFPSEDHISSGVRLGEHAFNGTILDVRSKRMPRKVEIYKLILSKMFSHLVSSEKPILWIDVGAGYGETVEAALSILPIGSEVIGIEPMSHKAESAKKLGLNFINDYLQPNFYKADVISIIDIYSHIADFWCFLDTIKSNLKPGGELLIESGNLADLDHRNQFFGELGVPDHLVFAGEKHFKQYLDRAGFDVIEIRRDRVDGFVNFLKAIIKRLLKRPVLLSVPYTSKYRQLKIRAKLRA